MPLGNAAITEICKDLNQKETDQQICISALLNYVDIDLLDENEQVLRYLMGAE